MRVEYLYIVCLLTTLGVKFLQVANVDCAYWKSDRNHSKSGVSITWLRAPIDWMIRSFRIFSVYHQCWDLIVMEHTFSLDVILKYKWQVSPINFLKVSIGWAIVSEPSWCFLGLYCWIFYWILLFCTMFIFNCTSFI